MDIQPLIDQLVQYGALGVVIMYLIRENGVLQGRIDQKNATIDQLQNKRIEDWRWFSDQRSIRYVATEGDTNPYGGGSRLTMPRGSEMVAPLPPDPPGKP